MKKHRKPRPGEWRPGHTAKKILPFGAMLAMIIWPGMAPGQTTVVEPPPVESFALGSGQDNVSADDTAINDLYMELVEGADAQAASPSVTGTPPLPPGTPVHSPTAQPGPAGKSSFSGTFDSPTTSGQDIEFVEPIESPNDPFRPSPGQESPNSVASPLSPPPDEANPFAPSTASQSGSISVPLGQGAALPQPGWQGVSETAPQPPSQYISDAPEPQFDAGQARWIQPEIGQSVSTGPPGSVSRPRPTSVSTVHTSPSEKLDAMMDDTAQAPALQNQADAPGRSPVTGGVQTPEGRERLRLLFPDLMSSDSQEAPTSAASGGQNAPPVPDFSGLDSQSSPSPGTQAGAVEEYDGSSAILKAGGLLTLESHYGGAEILPPLTGQPPIKVVAPPAEPALQQPEVQARKPEPVVATPTASSSGSSKKPRNAKATGSKRASSAKAKTSASVTAGNLMIINETGNPRVGEIYQSVLARMGHRVVSVAQSAPVGAPGQTVINYRPGYRAQAQAVARHLPGKKVLSEAKGGQVLASEVMVYIR